MSKIYLCPICNQKIKIDDGYYGKYQGRSICKECYDILEENDINTNNLDKYSLKELKIKTNIIEDDNVVCSIVENNINSSEQNYSTNEEKIEKVNKKTVNSKNRFNYIVLQVVLKESFIGTGSANLFELEDVINSQAKKGYRLHTISTTSSGSKGMFGGDRIQVTLVFEKIIDKD